MMTYWALVNFRYFKLHFASFVLIESYNILHLLHLIFAIFGAAGARRVMVQSEPRMNLRYSDARLKDVQLVLAPFTLRLFGAAGAHTTSQLNISSHIVCGGFCGVSAHESCF